jgi:sigma-E factor negative regulatory protein RseC
VITVRDGAVDVRVDKGKDCGGCSVCSKNSSGETVMQGVLDSLGATVGDMVDVEIPDTVRSKAAAAVFIVPVAAMLLGYLAGFLLGRWAGIVPDVGGIIGALVAANIAVLGARRAERTLSSNERYVPRVNAIISRGQDRV